jgi:hypothetical protein
MTPCCGVICGYQRFGGTYALQLQDWSNNFSEHVSGQVPIIIKRFGNTVQCGSAYICLYSAFTCFGRLWPTSEGNNMLRNFYYIDYIDVWVNNISLNLLIFKILNRWGLCLRASSVKTGDLGVICRPLRSRQRCFPPFLYWSVLSSCFSFHCILRSSEDGHNWPKHVKAL